MDFSKVGALSLPRIRDAMLRTGVEGLLRIGQPMDAVFALGAARLASRALGGRLPSQGLARTELLEMLGIAQTWAAEVKRNPFLAPACRANGVGQWALGLALDAHMGSTFAAELPGDVGAAGFGMWEDATEFHSYALLRLSQKLFCGLDGDVAPQIASAGLRHATRAIEHTGSGVPPTLPDWEEDMKHLRSVAKLASSRCGGKPIPRRSAPLGEEHTVEVTAHRPSNHPTVAVPVAATSTSISAIPIPAIPAEVNVWEKLSVLFQP